MKKALIVLIMLFLALPCFAGQYKVLKVVDGDTIDVLYMGAKERVRLLNVDTPESVHPDKSKNTFMGQKASAYTKKRLDNKSVDLEFESKLRGRYGRLLAYVIVDGVNYNLELVRNGWSPYHTKYGTSKKYHTHFMSAEQNAKAQGLNIWAVA
ncbi:MAG: nuclease, partial [Desulfobacteraceae bacterium]|nr:nuclease [Desulfobacteraceae bacterium]